jgi:NADH-quinone oxidoreductase subunit F
MYPQVLFKNRKPDRIASLEEYRASGGYEALANVLKNFSYKDVRSTVLDAMLLGRGGAAFPAGRKVMTVADDAPFPRYVVCNADEMEPGTFKDRVLIHADPHLLIEGMIIEGYSARAEKGIIFIRPEYESAARILHREIENAREAGYLGINILDSGYDFDIVVHRSGGRYICGEVTAQINALMGKRPNPKQPPPYATEKGLWQQPTVVHNVETLACIPHIIRNGSEWFRNLALTDTGSGTKIFCVSGKVNRPGCYELPMGIRLSEIIETHAGGIRDGAKFKACLPGGASTAFLAPEFYDIEMDFETMKKAGHRLGTGAIMVFDHKTCLVEATLNLTEFFARESCGWCTPCREGFPYLRDLLWRIENGRGQEEYVSIIKQMCRHLWNSYCAFAPGGIAPIESLLVYFKDEVYAHIREKKCPFKNGK